MNSTDPLTGKATTRAFTTPRAELAAVVAFLAFGRKALLGNPFFRIYCLRLPVLGLASEGHEVLRMQVIHYAYKLGLRSIRDKARRSVVADRE